MNEITFFLHIGIVLAFILLGVRMHKHFLMALIPLMAVLANLFVVKETLLFHLNVTCSDVFAVGVLFGTNLLQELYGKEAAKRVMKISLISVLFFLCMAFFHLRYLPFPEDTTDLAFRHILSTSPRICLASILVFFLVQRWDIWWFQKLQGWLQGKFLPFRVAASLVLSQLIDTVLFTWIGLSGNIQSIFDVILMSFSVKCVVILASSLFSLWSKRRHVSV